jgi:agmatine deiminase
MTPAAFGRLRMPAEWEPHAATWLAWPHNRSDWPGKFEPIPWVYAEIVRRLTPGERVRIAVQDAAERATARRVLKRAGVELSRVDFYTFPTDRVWTRDSGPIFVRGGGRSGTPGRVALHFRFNAWAKYGDWKRDQHLPARIAEALGVPRLEPVLERGCRAGRPGRTHATGEAPVRVVLEGGSIDVDGAGALLTTQECLLSPIQQRNCGFSRADYEQVFAEYLGVGKVIWLDRGIAGDDTHGHVDDLARFVDRNTVVVVQQPDRGDPDHEPLRENLRRLKAATDGAGRRLRVVALPMPEPLIFDGRRLPASYANFYIGNRVVLVPTFNDPADRLALGVLAELFPTRRVVGIHAVDLVWGLGTLHCMTQQEPAA